MVLKVLIYAAIVVLQLICLRSIFRRAWGTDDFGSGLLFLVLVALFGLTDAGALIVEVIRHWRG